jgi:hypothetical protein
VYWLFTFTVFNVLLEWEVTIHWKQQVIMSTAETEAQVKQFLQARGYNSNDAGFAEELEGLEEAPSQEEVEDAMANMKYLKLTCTDLADDDFDGDLQRLGQGPKKYAFSLLKTAAEHRALFMKTNMMVPKVHTSADGDELFNPTRIGK